MNIQIYGKAKCFDTKKAERYFKERKITYQLVDILKYGMSKGELSRVIKALGDVELLLDKTTEAYKQKAANQQFWSVDWESQLLEETKLFKTPIVRNGKMATVGFEPDIWKNWE